MIGSSLDFEIVALQQAFNLCHRHHVVVAHDGVFQHRGSGGKVELCLVVGIMLDGIKHASYEGIAHAKTVDDIADLINLGGIEVVVGKEHTAQGVML